ncbi:MAG: RNA 2'-phosphotransferase [Aeropyrum sp.]|nr:RNA 2'-phosphotransferase [Aeropyrum sp.]
MELLRDLYLCCDDSIVEDRELCSCPPKGVLGGVDRLRLSKRIAGLLRHYPHRYNVELDRAGWARIADIRRALAASVGPWVREWHVRGIAMFDKKGRYEVVGDKIRARYGHSMPVEVEPMPGAPPNILYHGTVEENLNSIMSRGIVGGRRIKVHLTSEFSDAVATAKRHGRRVVVLEVNVECIKKKGLDVERASNTVYTTKWVPPDCIKRVVKPKPG